MAKQRIINTRFWSDSYVVNLNPLDRYLFLYLLTNEHTNICGIYELPLVTMANESGLEKEMLSKMIKRLKGKVYYFSGWVYLKNFAKHQSSNESVKKGIETAKALVPKEIMEKVTACDSLSEPATAPGVFELELESNFNLNTKRISATASVAGKKKGNRKKDTTPFSQSEFISSMRSSPQRHMNLIAEYADQIQPDLKTKGQWYVFMSRNLRTATDLAPFSDDQIAKAFSHIKNNLKTEKNPKGYITKWGMETLLAYMHEK